MKRIPDDQTPVERTPLPPLDDIYATFRLHTYRPRFHTPLQTPPREPLKWLAGHTASWKNNSSMPQLRMTTV
jgi:hypothetical protein